MFTRVIRAVAADPRPVRAQWTAWHERFGAAAPGWLGSTAGIAGNGEFVAAVHWEKQAAARAHDDTTGPREWWEGLLRWFDGAPEVHDCSDCDVLLVGGGDAGFVQFITGRAPDPELMRAVNVAMEDLLLKHRPDIVGSEIAWHGDGRFTKVAYFLNESSARSWEGREFPGGLAALYDELMGLIEDVRFLDISDPWITRP